MKQTDSTRREISRVIAKTRLETALRYNFSAAVDREIKIKNEVVQYGQKKIL